jgi:acetyl-CoA carboxylase, biotin carboxylase subunit
MPPRPIRRLLVANRGEIAVRIMRTCRDLGIETVAVYSEVDRLSPHVQYADRACCIGPAPSAQSYLSIDAIIDAAGKSGADAIHPGYGFLSENAAFAKRVVEAGLTFVGPPSSAIRAMGDKTEARTAMKKAGVPVVPGTDGPVSDEKAAAAFCHRAGFPVLIKAAAGGGGKGMRVVESPAELAGALAAARSEARSAFGDDRVYLEKYLSRPRHIEFQIVADAHGSVVHLGERECSIQRRHQKVVEESPSVFIDADLRARMGAAAVLAARTCGYVNAGTIEFLVDANREFYFLEMNTRLQVEHPVTELRTGIDLVALQIHIASGGRLPDGLDATPLRGHAIECRICAEDPLSGFLPSTGVIRHFRPAEGPGIRNDAGVAAHGEITVHYDPLMAKLIAFGATRGEAIARMQRALAEYEVLGVQTNIPFCSFVVGHELFRAGTFDTHFVAQHFRPGELADPSAKALQAAAAVCAWMSSHPRGAAATHPPAAGVLNGKWRRERIRYMHGDES